MNGQECHWWRSCALEKGGCKGVGEIWKNRRGRALKEIGYDALACSSEKWSGCDPAFNSSLWSITLSNCMKQGAFTAVSSLSSSLFFFLTLFCFLPEGVGQLPVSPCSLSAWQCLYLFPSTNFVSCRNTSRSSPRLTSAEATEYQIKIIQHYYPVLK